MSKPIRIIGGGLAGLALGLGLRRRNVPVLIWEAGKYPRHRVCGEFISGRGQTELEQLGLREILAQAGAVTAATAVFCSGSECSRIRPLPDPALCVSRFTLDACLAHQFRASGGELQEDTRGPADSGKGVVHASGRRVQPVEKGWRWFGLKVHASQVPLIADLEMHSVPNGYIGLSRLAGGVVNICGLFRRSAAAGESGMQWRETLHGPAGTALHERLAEAVFDERSFCAVAGLTLRPQHASSQHECCLGDALSMIPPVTGNGMSMALEAATIAIEPLTAYSRGEASWDDAKTNIARGCDAIFARRLFWARWLHWLMFSPVLKSPLGAIALRSDWLWRALYERTR